MTDPDLHRLLARLPAPPPAGPAARGRAHHRALIALAQPGVAAASPSRRRRPALVASGLAAILAILFFIAVQPTRSHHPDVAAQRDLLLEIERSFPSHLQAVIERDGAIELVLAEQPTPPTDQRLLVEISTPRDRIRILSYSGRTVCVTVAGRPLCFELLLADNDDVIVSSDHFIWTPDHPATLAGTTLRAERLASSR